MRPKVLFPDQVSDNELINDAYRDETFLFREHIKKIDAFRVDPLEVLTDHIKVRSCSVLELKHNADLSSCSLLVPKFRSQE